MQSKTECSDYFQVRILPFLCEFQSKSPQNNEYITHTVLLFILQCHLSCVFRSGVLRTQKLKTHLLRSQSSKVSLSNPAVGQNIYIYSSPAATDFFRANFYFSYPFTFFFSFFQNVSRVFPVLAAANAGSCGGLHNKLGHPAYLHTQLMQVPVLSACGT